jgi:hypothetical protein
MATIHLLPAFPQEGPTDLGEGLQGLRWDIQGHQGMNQHRRERDLNENRPPATVHELGTPRLHPPHHELGTPRHEPTSLFLNNLVEYNFMKRVVKYTVLKKKVEYV